MTDPIIRNPLALNDDALGENFEVVSLVPCRQCLKPTPVLLTEAHTIVYCSKECYYCD